MKIYLHIGAGKCGSSSIQNFFSYNPDLGDRKAYCAINADGFIHESDDIRVLASRNVYDYLSSVSLSVFYGNQERRNNLKNSLHDLSSKYDEVLFSNEGWLDESTLFEELSDVFECYDVEIIFVVRTPVEWLNSGWWQWGQWSGASLDDWLDANIIKTDWYSYYELWNRISVVNEVRTLCLSQDILKEFSSIINFDYIPLKSNSNISSDYRLLRFFKERRALRPSPHSPQIEFSLNRYLQPIGKPDWVISRDKVAKIFRLTEHNNEKLLKVLFNPEAFESDPRWKGDGYYKDIDKKLALDVKLTEEQLLDMLEESYKVIHELDRELRNVQSHH